MSLIDDIKSVIAKLPHSESRVPYTYHHDYLRSKVNSFGNASRADVARSECWNDEELYATALMYLLHEINPETWLYVFDGHDLDICRDAIKLCNSYVNRLELEYDQQKTAIKHRNSRFM